MSATYRKQKQDHKETIETLQEVTNLMVDYSESLKELEDFLEISREDSSAHSQKSEQSPKFIKIRNRMYPIEILNNNPTLVQYVKNIDSGLGDGAAVKSEKSLDTLINKFDSVCELSNTFSGDQSTMERDQLKSSQNRQADDLLKSSLNDSKDNLLQQMLTQIFLYSSHTDLRDIEIASELFSCYD